MIVGPVDPSTGRIMVEAPGGSSDPARRSPGRPSRGVRVETKLRPEVLAQVEALIATKAGADRSEVIARLVELGLILATATRQTGSGLEFHKGTVPGHDCDDWRDGKCSRCP